MDWAHVPTLQNWCLKSVAANITRHGDMMKEIQGNQQACFHYETLRCLFPNDLLTELELMCSTVEAMDTEKINQFFHRLFFGEKSENNCLKLLYNEYTLDFYSNIRSPASVPKGLLHNVLQRCENLRSLTLKYYNFGRRNYISSSTYCNTLVKVDLLHSLNHNEMLMKILRHCPNLQIFKANGESITSRLLHCLCTKHADERPLVYADCDGDCGNIGKKISSLIIYDASFTPEAAACALQHLTSLKIFHDSLICYAFPSVIPSAVRLLMKKSLENQSPPVVLNLTTVYFPYGESLENILTVVECCPQLESSCLSLTHYNAQLLTATSSLESLKEINLNGSPESDLSLLGIPHFLAVRGHQLESVSVWGMTRIRLHVRDISNLLDNCKNLKKLYLHYLSVTCDRSENKNQYDRDCPNSLEKLYLVAVELRSPGVMRFFGNFLSWSRRLKFLCVSHKMASTPLISALKRNSFSSLEEISLFRANLNLSLRSLIHGNTCFKKITICECQYKAYFFQIHSYAARECHLALQINEVKFDRPPLNCKSYYMCVE